MVQQELKNLEEVVSRIAPWSLLSPTQEIYDKLVSGDEHDLQAVVNLMAHHLKISRIPIAKYEWSLKIPAHAAGEIRNPGAEVSVIRIPFAFVGKAYAIGAILAHEMSHQFLAIAGIWYPDVGNNEKLTDLASLAIGFGKFVLNGLALEASGVEGMAVVLGYIEPETKMLAYLHSCHLHGVRLSDSTSHLAKDVALQLEQFSSRSRKMIE